MLLKTLIAWSKNLFSQIHLHKQIWSQYTKKIPGMKKKITVLCAFSPTYLKFIGVACIPHWTSILVLFLLNTSLDLKRDIVHIERLRVSLDQNGYCAALLTDLFKAFDCLASDLLISKLHAYRCNLLSQKLFNFYLRSRY